jgi:hypothetical protein
MHIATAELFDALACKVELAPRAIVKSRGIVRFEEIESAQRIVELLFDPPDGTKWIVTLQAFAPLLQSTSHIVRHCFPVGTV